MTIPDSDKAKSEKRSRAYLGYPVCQIGRHGRWKELWAGVDGVDDGDVHHLSVGLAGPHRVAPGTLLEHKGKLLEGVSHLNRDKIESYLSVPGIQGHPENALIKSFEMSTLLIA